MTHTKKCLTKALISVLENWQDDGYISEHQFYGRVGGSSYPEPSLLVEAQSYLEDGLVKCSCDRVPSPVSAQPWEAMEPGQYCFVASRPNCDIHFYEKGEHVPAFYDGKLKSRGGRAFAWAYMCEECFAENGVGLGDGLGQRLFIKEAN